MVRSIAPLVTGVVAVDGAYDLYPQGRARSPLEATIALHTACRRHRLSLATLEPSEPWRGNEVEKRSALFSLACSLAVPHRDWFLVIDADMTLTRCDVRTVRERLRETARDVAEVTFREADPLQGPFNPKGVGALRSLFRANRTLTVEGAHTNYVIERQSLMGRRELDKHYLWHAPPRKTAEPALDLTDHLELHHRSHDERKPSRAAGREGYYQARSDHGSERH